MQKHNKIIELAGVKRYTMRMRHRKQWTKMRNDMSIVERKRKEREQSIKTRGIKMRTRNCIKPISTKWIVSEWAEKKINKSRIENMKWNERERLFFIFCYFFSFFFILFSVKCIRRMVRHHQLFTFPRLKMNAFDN